jgi:hypothetical protein
LYGRQDLTTREVFDAVLAAYKADTGIDLDLNEITTEERQALRLYVVERNWTSEGSLFHNPNVLTHLPLFADMADKVGWLHQHACIVCPPVEDGPPPTYFPIGLPPWSHQSKGYIGPALKQAIEANDQYAARLMERTTDMPLCVRVVFVLEDLATMKDCDNMAKGLLDAFQGLIYVNDTQIEHLDLIKTHHAEGSAGYILLSHRPTRINDHTDVIHPMHPIIGWMGSDTLDLTPFLPN